MNKIYLSKSRYCKAVQCNKILWLNKYKPDVAVQRVRESVLENGTKVGDLARGLFGKFDNVEFDINLDLMIQKTNELLQNKPNIITEASFNFDNNFCSVDILKNDTDGVEIYEVKSSVAMSDIYLDDASYQYYVLSNLGYHIKKVCIVYINNQYVRKDKLELDKLFNIEDITEIAVSKQEEITNKISEINNFMNDHNENNEPNHNIGIHCFNPYDCEFWQYCTRNLPNPNVFDIFNMHKDKKIEKYNEGLISFEDLQYEDLNQKFLEQIDFELHDKPAKIENEPIKELMNSLKYPLYFIDFETFQLAVPEYEGTKPYQQLPFQYSLHIIESEGEAPQHKEFLAEIDDENFIRHFAESMIKDLPQNGSVIIYNNSFEPARIKEMTNMFPDLEDELMRINSNIVDFMPIFRNRNYYMKEMQGSYSIKYVLPALYPNDPELDYHKLPVVHNGTEASDAFLSLKGKSKEEQEIIRNGLLVYCKLDTYAMVKVWEKLKEIVEGDK